MDYCFSYTDPATKKDEIVHVGIPPSSTTPDFLKDQNLTSPPPLKLLYKPYSAQEWYEAMLGMDPSSPLNLECRGMDGVLGSMDETYI